MEVRKRSGNRVMLVCSTRQSRGMRVTASEEVEQPFPLARERTVAGLEKVLVVVL